MKRALRLAAAALLLHSSATRAQQLGHKLLGSSGIDAGVQSPPGLFVIGRMLRYDADQLRGASGERLPIDGLDMEATGIAFGAAYTLRTADTRFLTLAIGIPVASIHINSDQPAASLSGYGFSDVFVQPLEVGWRKPRFDVVTAYMIYVPTGKFEPRGSSVGRGYWTHELSLGGAMFLDTARISRISALASYDFNTRKRGIRVRRGNMFQIQGGAGIGVGKGVTVGAAGYALWQATRDRGADIPPQLLGQWSRAYGLGPEIDVVLPKLRTRFDVRVEHELGVKSRPKGRVISAGLSYMVWAPAAQKGQRGGTSLR
jgi:hypothetical protein